MVQMLFENLMNHYIGKSSIAFKLNTIEWR